MRRYFSWKKLAPFMAIFGAAIALITAYRAYQDTKSGGAGFFASFWNELKALFTASIVWIALFAGIYALLNPGPEGIIMAVVWGSVGASTTGTFTFNFVPQFIEFVAATSPTLFQINVNGDGMVFNLDLNGLSGMTHIRAASRVTNSYLFQIADGLLNNKNGTVTITTGTSAVTVRAWSPVKNGTMYCTFNPAAALAAQAFNLQKFAYASFPSAAATDAFQVAYADGSLDNMTREELNVYLGYTENSGITKYAVDNISPARISMVTFTPVAAQTFYVMKYQPASGIINGNPNV